MMPGIKVSLAVLALSVQALSIGGCSQDDQMGDTVPVANKLHGIVVVPPGASTTTVFLGRQADLQQQLKDAQAGVKMAEIWHMLVMPVSFLPAVDGEQTYDLSQNLGITITENTGWPMLSIQPGDLNWGSFSLASGATGLQGKLTITGAEVVTDVKPRAVVPQGEFFGVAYSIEYNGPLDVSNGAKLKNHTEVISVGTFAAKTP